MLRKLFTKIRQSFSEDAKHPETKPAAKSGRPPPKGGEHRHDDDDELEKMLIHGFRTPQS